MGRALAIVFGSLAVLALPGAALGAETTYTLEVPTGTIGGYEVKYGEKVVPTPPGEGHITAMSTEIVDAATGAPVPISRLMLHHIVFHNVGKPDNTCRDVLALNARDVVDGRRFQRFYSAGEERNVMDLPPGYGYPLESDARWAIFFMVMNHRALPDHAMIRYRVTVETEPLIPVEPYWLDVRNCRADPVYNVPGTAGKKDEKGKPKKAKRNGDVRASGKKNDKQKKKKKKKKKRTHLESADFVIPEAGRIVAGTGHVHGGALDLRITKPNCGGSELSRMTPTWGTPAHPFYNVRPKLHEPGPIDMRAFSTSAGIPVSAGERLRLSSRYENTRPHVRVMGIAHLYLAPPSGPTPFCGGAPADLAYTSPPAGRSKPPRFKVPLTRLGPGGRAVSVKKLPGKLRTVKNGATTVVGDRFFSRPNVRIKRGRRLNWVFSGGELHNLTLANGPVGIGSENLDLGRRFSKRFRRPGTYRFLCSLHPVQMAQRVVVEGPEKDAKRRR